MKERDQRLVSDRQWSKKFKEEPWDQLMMQWENRPVFKGDQFHFHRNEHDYSRVGLANMLEACSLGIQEDHTESLRMLDKPILWMAGELDEKFAAITEQVDLSHPLSQKWIAPGCGHRVVWQQTQQFIDKVNAFLHILEEAS